MINHLVRKTSLAAIVFAGAATLLSAGTAKAAAITTWGFESLTVASAAGTTPSVTAGGSGSNVNSDAGSAVSGTATALHASASTVYSTPAGNGSVKAFSSNNWSVGDYYQFTTNTTGVTGVEIEFDHVASSTGPQNFKVAYSTDGITFTDLAGGSYTMGPAASIFFSSGSALTGTPPRYLFDLGGALDNAPTAIVRLIDTSAPSGGAGTSRVDNFTIGTDLPAPTPEPGSIALLGLGSLGLLARRRHA